MDIREIISQLTLEEKCYLCAQKDGSFGRIERLGCKGNVPQDNPRNGEDYYRSGMGENDGKYHPVAFPPCASIGMSWDRELAYETGRYLAIEGKANPEKVTWIFRPGVNIKRSPLCGRNFEYISEDPVASGELAAAYIRGMQSEGVAATLKHFVCNNQEFERMTTNSLVSERTLREIYLKPFEIALKKGRPWSVMTSYNQVNGQWVNSNPHLMQILREEFSYDGVVVSDFAAIHHNKVEAHRNRMDIELAPNVVHSEELLNAVNNGKIDEKLLDEALYRVLSLCARLEDTPACEADMAELHESAREAAEKSIVLLENKGVLPLKPESREKLLVVGSLAENPSYMGGGSGHMNGWRIDKPLAEIEKRCAHPVAFAKGYESVTGYPPEDVVNPELLEEAARKAAEADTVIVFAGLDYCYESEGYDRRDILLPESQRLLLERLMRANGNIVLVVSAGSVIDLSAYKDKLAAIVYTGYAGEAFGSAIANILFGLAEPGGRLSESFPLCLEHSPAALNFAEDQMDMQNVSYGEGVFVGYRWYEARKLPVAYPFGHGLSYTKFEIKDCALSSETMRAGEGLDVNLRVKNVGARRGSQVIQVYVGDEKSSVRRPPKELKAFHKLTLDPGEERKLTVHLDTDAFSFFSEQQNKWITESGFFSVYIGLSSQNILWQGRVNMTEGEPGIVYTRMTPLVWFLKSERFMALMKQTCPPELYHVFEMEKYDGTALIAPLPFYKMAENYLGQVLMTDEQIDSILRYMNES